MTARRALADSSLAALVLAVAAGCGGRSAAPPPIRNSTADEVAPLASDAGLPDGVSDGALWTCTIGDYDAQPCRFSRTGAGWRLVKLLGSQRFAGDVGFPADGSIRFAGTFFCPWGDCETPMEVTFVPEGAAFVADLEGEPVRLEWSPANAEAYGGAGYGGLTGREAD